MKHRISIILFFISGFAWQVSHGANINLPSYYANDLIQEDKITKNILSAIQKVEHEYSNGRYAILQKEVSKISSNPSDTWTEDQIAFLNKSIDEMKEISKNLSKLGDQIEKDSFELYTLFAQRLGKIDAANDFCNIKQPKSFSIIEKTNDMSNAFNQDKMSFLKRAYNMHKLVAPMVLREDKNFDCSSQKKYSDAISSNIKELLTVFSGLNVYK